MMREQDLGAQEKCLAAVLAMFIVSGARAESHAGDCSADGLRSARERFNQAIVGNDTQAMAGLFDPDVVLVTGTDSDRFIGRDSQLALWRSDIDDAERLIYRRETTRLSLSPLHPIAMEAGRWTGRARNGDELGGEYSAKWRCEEDRWMLEAEMFMTTRCSGGLCDP
jgi:ketosteroid isomerase-like protein